MVNDGWNLEHTYAGLPKIFYRKQNPVRVPVPQTVIFNEGLARDLGLDYEKLKQDAEIFAGNKLPPNSLPIAQAYAGYQFGHFAMLGDGRAILLGEQVTPNGRRFDIQLKGSGRTRFSRGGDGYAALQPMLREYIISEAMFSLGIPTTRSLAVVSTGRDVIREKTLPGAVLTRVAASHIRVGTFNYVAAFGTADDLRALADYTILRHFPALENESDKYVLLLREVAQLQAALIAQWQLVGFIHGVMNTDNMAVSGETIDFGPCAFMDTYDPNTVFSSIDTEGRYSYKNQPAMGAWNLARFAESLLPLIHENKANAAEQAHAEISNYWEYYNTNWLNGMRKKLGFTNESPQDAEIATELLDIMEKNKLDYTNTFYALSTSAEENSSLEIPSLSEWAKKWRGKNPTQPRNPAVIPRNHRVEEALSAAEQGDLSVMHNLLSALQNPYQPHEEYSQPPPPTHCNYKTFCGT